MRYTNDLERLLARRLMKPDGGGAGGTEPAGSEPGAVIYTQAQLDAEVSRAVNAKVKELEQAHKAALEAKDLDFAVRGQLIDAHDADLVMGLLDMDKLKLKDGKVEGLEEQLKGLRESKSFLFANPRGAEPSRMTGAAPAQTGSPAAGDDMSAMQAEVAKYFNQY